MTDEQHNKYIAWTFIGHGVFQLLIMLLMLAFFSLFFFIPARPGDPGPPPFFFGFIFAFVIIFQMIFTAPSFIAAYGLFKKKQWARIASIIAGILSAMNVPIGTAACVYALWFFMGENWKSIYEPQMAATEPQLISPPNESRWTGYQTDEKGEVTYQPVIPPDWR